MNLEFINKVIRYKYDSNTFLAVSPKGYWSIRTIDGNILEYGTNLTDLYKELGLEDSDENSENYQRIAGCAHWQI